MAKQIIFKYSCGTCKKAKEDPHEQYLCPQGQNHGADGEKQDEYGKI